MKYHKFRELNVDIFKLPFKNIKVSKILNYMPAGNDVLEINTDNKGICILKVERSKVSDFFAEFRHISYLASIKYDKVPKIIEFYDDGKTKCIVENKIKGKRLSEVVNENNKSKYLFKMGEELSKIHSLSTGNCTIGKQRVINDVPYDNLYCKFDKKIMKYIDFLNKNNYNKEMDTFIHGDFHYGNILWFKGNINAVLDWEYSGVGHKEQDIAWAIVLRPGQCFLDNIDDIKEFLKGYETNGNYDFNRIKWCYINACAHFYLMNKEESYKDKLISLMNIFINKDKI